MGWKAIYLPPVSKYSHNSHGVTYYTYHYRTCSWLNSSPPSAAYMHQWMRLALVQIMACHLLGAKPLSKPVLGTPRNKLQWNYQNTKLFIHKNASENIVWEKAAILSRGRWVNTSRPEWKGWHFTDGKFQLIFLNARILNIISLKCWGSTRQYLRTVSANGLAPKSNKPPIMIPLMKNTISNICFLKFWHAQDSVNQCNGPVISILNWQLQETVLKAKSE